MNQILVTEKIYVTPELKRKKKVYKTLFILSILLIISLILIYSFSNSIKYFFDNNCFISGGGIL